MRITTCALAIAAVALCACESEQPPLPQPDAGEVEVEPSPTFSLNWTQKPDHPAREVLSECHRLTERQLAAIWVQLQDEPDFAQLAPYWDGPTKFEGEESRVKANIKYAELVRTEIADIADSPWCVELNVELGDYDFDRQKFDVQGVLGVSADLTTSGQEVIERVEIESGDKPPPLYQHPIFIGLRHSFDSVSVRQSDAKPILESRRTDDEVEGAGPSLADRFVHIKKLPRPAVRAVFDADSPEDDDDDEKKGPTGFESLRTSVDALSDPDTLPMRLVVSVDPAWADTKSGEYAGSTIELKRIVFGATHAVFTIDDRVIDALGSDDDMMATSMPPWSRRSRDEVLESACAENLSWSRRRELSGGAIVERLTPYCSRCPAHTANAGDYSSFRLTALEVGTFGYGNRTAAFVAGIGCAPRSEGEGYLTALRQDLFGTWYVSDSTGGLFDCARAGTDETASALVCSHYYTGAGGYAEGWVTIIDIAPNGDIRSRDVVRTTDGWTGGCHRSGPMVWPQEITRNDDGSVLVRVKAGTPGPEDECGEDFEGLEYQLVVSADADQVSLNEQSSDAVTAINRLFEEQ